MIHFFGKSDSGIRRIAARFPNTQSRRWRDCRDRNLGLSLESDEVALHKIVEHDFIMERSIIHLNVADFAVAVERVVNSGLRERPVVVAPQGSARARVYDMSEEAYQCGVRKNMPLRTARRLCRDAHVLPPRPDRYERAMRALFKRALTYSPLVESGEVDGHLFVDITGTSRLFGPSVDVAWRMRRQV